MPSRKLILLVAVIAILAGLLVRAPASVLGNATGLPEEAFSGTLWNGQLQSVTVGGETIAPIRWKLAPAALLKGRARAHVEASASAGTLSGTLSTGFDEVLEGSDLDVTANLDAIDQLASYGPVAGTVVADIDRVVIAGNELRSLAGQATVQGLVYPAIGRYALGDFRVQCEPVDNLVSKCQINDTASPVELDARAELASDGTYVVDGRIRARPDAPAELVSNLRFLGQPDAAGFYPLGFSGSLH